MAPDRRGLSPWFYAEVTIASRRIGEPLDPDYEERAV